MSLKIIRSADERLVSAPVLDALRDALSRDAMATLVTPSFEDSLVAQRSLSTEPGLGVGVTVTTPLAWAKERWEVWGDGTHVIEPLTRTLAAQQVLLEASQDEERNVTYNRGSVKVVSSLASRALPWIPIDPSGALDVLAVERCGLTHGERDLLSVLGDYGRLVRRLGYLEESEVLGSVVHALTEAGVNLGSFVFSGFQDMPRAQRELVLDLSRATDVVVVASWGNEQAMRGQQETIDLLLEEVSCLGTDVREISPEVVVDARRWDAPRSRELSGVLDCLFEADGEPIAPEGALGLLLPAGPEASAEVVAREVVALASGGMRDIVVSTPDSGAAWRDLAPKLHARGLSVAAVLQTPVTELAPGRAFFAYAETVATLVGLDRDWPAAVEGEEEGTTVVSLGDMSWWPPTALVDFLLSDVSQVDPSRAWRLDRAWRADRLLTPGDVLRDLENPKATSPSVAQATRELVRGRLGSAASKLLMPLVAPGDEAASPIADDLASEEAKGTLAAVLNVAGTLKELGVTADPSAGRAIELSGLVRAARHALDNTMLVVRPRVVAEGGAARVRILPAERASRLAPCSADAIVLMGMTSSESPVGNGDDVLTALLESLGIEPHREPMASARSSFYRSVRCARSAVSAERMLFDADSKECYPSVMLTELMACYGVVEGERDHGPRDRGIRVETLGESMADANLSPSGSPSSSVGAESVAPAGLIGPASRHLVIVPPEGRPELVGGKPLLSASQLESYLECPYKWFSLRRLRLQDSDAGFGAMEMGTFAHRVLELTHQGLLESALASLDESGREVPDIAGGDLTPRVPGSRVSVGDEGTSARAQALLGDVFDLHLQHQFIREGKRTRYQAFVPHSSQDEGMLDALRRDLLSVLDYEAGLFLGFEPRLFEWNFGKSGEVVEYAGAFLTGTIDRVDVDAHGNAVVIDYKHKSTSGFLREYGAFGEEGPVAVPDGVPFPLSRRVQSLMYGQVVRRAHPELKVKAAVYLSTRAPHALSGAVDANLADNVFGDHMPGAKAMPRVVVPAGGMDELLDSTEDAIFEKVSELMAGNIEANPIDAEACSFCPVMNCEKRISK